MKDIDRERLLFEGLDPVDNSSRNAPHIAGLEDASDAADRELDSAFDQDAHLFVRVRMIRDNRSGFKVNDREHQLLAGNFAEVYAGKNLMVRERPG
jgi:hypothetical protein